ncbi:MAG: type II toxin-antitoxin system prevent-host-death family antitoxin [Treponema sp.]|jgi:prevent-host-death family protein|nr:type II toxin-antitoxin system prevent-host-death family antitoxin [Treponema sp.]
MKHKHSDHESFAKEPEAAYSVETVSIHEAKTNLSKLVKRAAAGETIYIGAYGKPTVAIISSEYLPRKKPVIEAFGALKGKMELPEGWDDPLPDDIIDLFYNSKGLEEFEKK